MAKGTVVVIDDARDLIELVRYNLEKEGYDVVGVLNGQAGLETVIKLQPALVVLDLMLPDIDGLEVCRRLRQNGRSAHVPIIMLTAKAAEADRVVGLEIGADDYVTKPFSPRELVARIKAVLRRIAGPKEASGVLRHGALVIDPVRHEVSCRGHAAPLTATEFRVLHFLAEQPGRAYSRNEIIDGALGDDVAVMDRTVDVHILSIRRKLGACASYIETLRGVGYRFKSEE
ncbi:MAG: response regulator transcription factor [Planctomycetota bacterium]